MVCFLTLHLVLIIVLVRVMLCIDWRGQDVKSQGEVGDVLIFELFWHYSILLNVIIC
jgi:hypothetical protein